MDFKKEYITPDIFTIDCSIDAMIATSGLGGNEVVPGEGGYDGKFQSNRRNGWTGNGFWK